MTLLFSRPHSSTAKISPPRRWLTHCVLPARISQILTTHLLHAVLGCAGNGRESLSFSFCHFHLQLHISKDQDLSTNILFQLTFQSVIGPHQKEQALPRYQFRFGSFHKGNPYGLSATLHSPFQGKTWLIGETDEETLYSVPTVPGFGKLQPVNQIQPTTWFCSFSFMRTRPYWFLHLCSVALSHLKSRGKE